MSNSGCKHLKLVQEDVTPSADGCEDCLKIGDIWVHLRLCLICGHVGCCDSSKNKHATKHFHSTKHPIIQSFEPNEEWRWCYVDNTFLWNKFKIIDLILHWPGLRLTKSVSPLALSQLFGFATVKINILIQHHQSVLHIAWLVFCHLQDSFFNSNVF